MGIARAVWSAGASALKMDGDGGEARVVVVVLELVDVVLDEGIGQ